MVLLGLNGLATEAPALEDGGGRSVFAYGAGNRALALGGAYAAVADDASAALWNPGGLGWVERKQVQVTHTNLIGLGFSEQYASLVLPSWRLGTASVTFRRFGVGGIEERSERNVVLRDDLSDNETEIALGYGRGLGDAWTVGGAVKLQRQELAGVSASGVGLDLGLLVRPLQVAGVSSQAARSLAMGLAVRNAVEPSIRLDEEPVHDPTGVRFGMAYSHHLGTRLRLLGACDVENTRDMDTRLHAGLEADYQSILALRFGMNHGTFLAGTGVQWHDLSVDYVFEDNSLESVHRIGIAFTFGPAKEQSRQNYLLAEEEKLQERLAQTFEERNRDRIKQVLERARKAIAAEQFDETLEYLAMVDVLSPGEPGVRDLYVAAYRGRGLAAAARNDYAAATVDLGRALSLQPQDREVATALQQVRAESDIQAARSAEIRQQLDEALDAFADGDLLQAREGFERVLEVDPYDQDALAMLRRTRGAIRQRALGLLQQARTLAQAGQVDEAESALSQARQLDPTVLGTSSVRDLIVQVRRVQEDEAKRSAAAATEVTTVPSRTSGPVPAATASQYSQLSDEKRREMADLYRRGMEAIEAGRNDDAVRYWELVWSTDPGYQRVAEYLKHEYLARGMESFAAGRLQEAVADWENALQIDPTDEKALGYLERAQEQLLRIEKILDES